MPLLRVQVGPQAVAAIWAVVFWLAIILHGDTLFLIGALAFIVSLLVDGPLGKAKRWLISLGVVTLLSAFLLGDKTRTLWFISYSPEGLLAGLEMATRALMVLTGTRFLTNHLSPVALTAVLEKRFTGLGFALGIAFNIISELTKRLWEIAICFNQRRNGRIALSDFKRFLLAVFIDVLNAADELAVAARLRGLTQQVPKFPLHKSRFDSVVLGVCLVIGVVSTVLRFCSAG